jgi:hypothetical protein
MSSGDMADSRFVVDWVECRGSACTFGQAVRRGGMRRALGLSMVERFAGRAMTPARDSQRFRHPRPAVHADERANGAVAR